MNISLLKARELSENILTQLRPYCARIEVVGECRMESATMAGLEFVVAPHDFTAFTERCARNCHVAFVSEHLGRVSIDTKEGITINFHVATWIPRDLFVDERGSFGVTMLLRTGSRNFLKGFLRYVREHRYTLDADQGLKFHGRLVAVTEEDIFFALGLEFIEPRERTEFRPTPLFASLPC